MGRVVHWIKKEIPLFRYVHHVPAFIGFLLFSLGITIGVSTEFFIPFYISTFFIIIAITIHKTLYFLFLPAGFIFISTFNCSYVKDQNRFCKDQTDYTISYLQPPQSISNDVVKQIVKAQRGELIGNVLVEIESPISPGEIGYIRGTFIPYSTPQYPWQFNLFNYGKAKNCLGKIQIDSLLSNYTTSGVLNRSSSAIKKQFETFSNETSSLLFAMYMGNKSLLTQQLKFAFRTLGTSHLLALSGLHVGTMVMILLLILKCIPLSKGVRTLIAIVLPWILILFTGPTPSIIRSLIMTSAILSSVILRKSTNTLNAIGIAGLIILICNPYQLFTPSFLLSFSAVLGIASLINSIEQSTLTHRGRRLAYFIGVPCVAFLFTAPSLLYFYNEIQIYSPLINMFVTPLFSLFFMTTTFLLPIIQIEFIHTTVESIWTIFIQLLNFLSYTVPEPLHFETIQISSAILMFIGIIISLTIPKKHSLWIVLILFLIHTSLKKGSIDTKITTDEISIEMTKDLGLFLTNSSNSEIPYKWFIDNCNTDIVFIRAPSESMGSMVDMALHRDSFKQIFLSSPDALKKELDDYKNERIIIISKEDSLSIGGSLVYP